MYILRLTWKLQHFFVSSFVPCVFVCFFVWLCHSPLICFGLTSCPVSSQVFLPEPYVLPFVGESQPFFTSIGSSPYSKSSLPWCERSAALLCGLCVFHLDLNCAFWFEKWTDSPRSVTFLDWVLGTAPPKSALSLHLSGHDNRKKHL